MSVKETIDQAYAKVSLKEKIAYGSGDFASNLILSFITAYSSYFYSKALGLPTEMTGVIFLVSRIFDGISDVVMGIVIDKTKARHGKARSWILWLAIPFSVSAVLMMLVPQGWGQTAKGIYVFLTYNCTTTVLYTAINLPYGVLNSLITRDRDQRAVLNIVRMVMAGVGVFIVNAGTMPLVNSLGGTQGAWVTVVSIYAVLACVLFLLCFFGTKERVTAEVTGQYDEVPVMAALGSVVKNRYWWMILLLSVFDGIGTSIGNTINVYYADYILGDSNLMTLLTVVATLPMLAALPFSAKFIQKKGKRNAMLLGHVLSCLFCSLRLLAPMNVPFLLVMIGLKGMTVTLTGMVGLAMLADTIEYGQWKTGIRAEGMTYSAGSMAGKIAGGLGSAIIGILLGLVSFDGTLAIQPESALHMIQALFLYPSIMISAINIVILCFYDLDKRYPSIIEDLKRRAEKA